VNCYFPGVLYWLGGAASIISNSPQKAQFIRQNLNRFYVAGFPENPFSIRYSDLADPTSWPTTNWFDISGNRGPITGLERQGDQLIIFTTDSIMTLQGDPAQGFRVSVLHDGVGATIPTSIVTLGNVTMFSFQDDLMVYNGGVQVVAERLRGVTTAVPPGVPTSALTRVWAALTPHYYWYRMSLNSTDAAGGGGPAFNAGAVGG